MSDLADEAIVFLLVAFLVLYMIESDWRDRLLYRIECRLGSIERLLAKHGDDEAATDHRADCEACFCDGECEEAER